MLQLILLNELKCTFRKRSSRDGNKFRKKAFPMRLNNLTGLKIMEWKTEKGSAANHSLQDYWQSVSLFMYCEFLVAESLYQVNSTKRRKL